MLAFVRLFKILGRSFTLHEESNVIPVGRSGFLNCSWKSNNAAFGYVNSNIAVIFSFSF